MDRSHSGLNRRNLLLRGSAVAAVASGWPVAALAQASTLRAAITGYTVIDTLDPGKATLIPEFYVIEGLYNALMKFDAKMNPVPDLAESVKASDDGALEFRLRQGVQFHDGDDLTSDDVKFTIERLLDDNFDSPHKSKVSAVDRIETPDPLTVRLVTKQPFAPLLTFLANARTGTQIVSRKSVAAAGDDFGKKPVGTGAYMLKDWQPGERVTVAAFDNYFGGKPQIGTIEMPLIAEESSGRHSAPRRSNRSHEHGALGRHPEAAAEPVDRAAQAAGHELPLHLPEPSAAALRRSDLPQGLLARLRSQRHGERDPVRRGHAERRAHPAFARIRLSRRDAPAHHLYNAERARAELSKSKYKPGQKGVVLSLSQTWWKRIAEVFVAQVNQTLGTKLTVEVTEANRVFQRLQVADYQACAWGWDGLIDADEYTYEILHTKGWRNFEGYSNPKLDGMLETARRELDKPKRGAIYKEAETAMLEDMPILPCFCFNIHNLMTKRVRGFEQLPFSNWGDQFAHLTIG